MSTLRSGPMLAAVLAAAPALAQQNLDLVMTAKADLQDADGNDLGNLVFMAMPAGVLVFGELRGLPPGSHGFHVHDTGTCEPPFESAGDHLNPEGTEHGFRSENGPHAGDMTNINVPEDGQVMVELIDSHLKLDTDLFDSDGAAVVLHADPDDYRSQPSGASADRITCGVIEPD